MWFQIKKNSATGEVLSNPGKVKKKRAQLVANASQLASGTIGKSETESKTKSKQRKKK